MEIRSILPTKVLCYVEFLTLVLILITNHSTYTHIGCVSSSIVSEFQEGGELDELQSFPKKNLVINEFKWKSIKVKWILK